MYYNNINMIVKKLKIISFKFEVEFFKFYLQFVNYIYINSFVRIFHKINIALKITRAEHVVKNVGNQIVTNEGFNGDDGFMGGSFSRDDRFGSFSRDDRFGSFSRDDRFR